MKSLKSFLSGPPPWAKAALILLLGFIVYWPAINNGFLWDDDVMLTANEVMKADDGLRRIWLTTELSDYFPLTSTSFWIEWRIWGLNPVGYNVTNILLHLFSGILVWRLLLRLGVRSAWLAALFFTLHPVCVASVDWIAERKNTLSMIFYLGAWLLYLRFESGEGKRFYLLALGTFLLALLAKTSVVVLPAALLLCAWWQRGRIAKQDVIRSVPFFAVSLLLGLVTVWFQLHEILKGEAQPTESALVRMLGGTWALWFYLGKAVWPVNLSMIYPQWAIDPANVVSYLPGLLWACGLFVCWKFRATWGRAFFFGLGYFTLALLPVLGIIPMDFLRFSQAADHLQYIALPGAIALATSVTIVTLGRLTATVQPRSAVRYAWIVPTLALCLLTWKQSGVYTNQETLWRDTIKKNPTGWIGYHNLADTLAEQHRFEEAAFYYQESLRLEPDYAKTHNNFGNCLFILGKVDDAIERFMDAIQNKPELAEAHHNLGIALYQRKQYAESLEAFDKAIELQPDYASAHFAAGNAALQLGDVDTALDHYFTSAKYNPDAPDVHYNIGIVLSVRGETNSAVRHLQRALRLQPNHDLAQHELSLLLADSDPAE